MGEVILQSPDCLFAYFLNQKAVILSCVVMLRVINKLVIVFGYNNVQMHPPHNYASSGP